MAVEAFNSTFLGVTKVPKMGSIAGSTARPKNYDTRTTATGNPSGVQSFDPAGSPRVTPQCFEAALQSATPTGSAKFTPAAVDSFTDRSV